MIKEEFIDKITVANNTIDNLTRLLQKIEQTKKETIAIYIQENLKLKPLQRVRVYQNESTENTNEKKFLGYAYVNGAWVDEDYGFIAYPLVKENLKNKTPMTEPFNAAFGVTFDNFMFCNIIIENV